MSSPTADRFLDLMVVKETPERFGSSYDWFQFGGSTYPFGASVQTTMPGQKAELIGDDFRGYVEGAYKQNGVVFAVCLARLLLFTEARFQWQQMRGGRPGALFGTPDLEVLEVPWRNGTTGDLLARWEQHASFAGNGFVARRPGGLRIMRPDWTGVVMSGEEGDLDSEVIGYIYWQGGIEKGRPITLLPEDVAHFAPIPDPLSPWRGMSWLTPVVREVMGDAAATDHKLAFFENAATPNLAVKLSEKLPPDDFAQFVETMRQNHRGVENAWETLYLGGGADVTVVGADMKQLDFKVTQGAGETRIAAAGGVPPVIVGLSEGLDASTYSNYGQARRKFADGWARPQWRMAAGALASIVQAPAGSRLWYDDRDIPFLQEDQKDAADILSTDSQSVRQLTDGGYTPESVVKAIDARDITLLEHTGLVPVQLQAPGSEAPALPA
ncbi:MAG: phage portal protein [Acidimicrobiales bacterium]|nr:phage portal protein [Acidimicrobiales bacterium]